MSNPFLRLYEAPVETLTDLGWVAILLALLTATWWAAGRNLLWLDEHYQEGWKYLITADYALRTIAMFVIVAADLWLIAAIVGVLA